MSNYRKIIILGENEYVLGVNYKHYTEGHKCREILSELNVTNYMFYQLKALNQYMSQIRIEKAEGRLKNTPVIMISNPFRIFIRDVINRQATPLTEDETELMADFHKLYFNLIACIRLVNLDRNTNMITDNNELSFIEEIITRCNARIKDVTTSQKNIQLVG